MNDFEIQIYSDLKNPLSSKKLESIILDELELKNTKYILNKHAIKLKFGKINHYVFYDDSIHSTELLNFYNALKLYTSLNKKKSIRT